MNILLVIADLGLGGAQQVVINLANELSRQGNNIWIYDVFPHLRKEGMVKKISNDVHLISPNYSEQPNNLLIKLLNSILYRSGLDKNFLHRTIHKNHKNNLFKLLKSNTVDVINSHVWWADEFVYSELEHYYSKWWITLHASYSAMLKNEDKNGQFQLKANKVLNASKGIIYVSDNEIDNIRKNVSFYNNNIHKILNGIPESILNKLNHNNEQDEMVLLCASRAIPEKGWEELIQAFLLVKERISIKLLFAGDGSNLEILKSKYSKEKNIDFLGFQNDIYQIMTNIDVVILPSYSEALPTILIESIFQNIPVISTEVGEVKMIIENDEGKCGILIPASKGEELVIHLSEAIMKMYLEIELYRSNKKVFDLARNKFSVERMADDYLKQFKND